MPYREVRALSRGVALIGALNRSGPARPAELAAAVGIDRTTTYRLLATLERLGLIAQRPSDGAFFLTASVRGLSDGFVERDALTQCVALQMGALFQQVVWPSDFATFEQGSMLIRESTHRFSPYSVHRATIGRKRGLLTTALGRAFLAGASDAQRAAVMEIARGAGVESEDGAIVDGSSIQDSVTRAVRDYQARGYAVSVGETEPHISAIALPIAGPAGALGAINIVFFRSAMSTTEAAKRYLTPLRTCVQRIEMTMAGGDEGNRFWAER
jgi:IclR family mhp operon transcriptional activator